VPGVRFGPDAGSGHWGGGPAGLGPAGGAVVGDRAPGGATPLRVRARHLGQVPCPGTLGGVLWTWGAGTGGVPGRMAAPAGGADRGAARRCARRAGQHRAAGGAGWRGRGLAGAERVHQGGVWAARPRRGRPLRRDRRPGWRPAALDPLGLDRAAELVHGPSQARRGGDGRRRGPARLCRGGGA
jgi:hypothetical protein